MTCFQLSRQKTLNALSLSLSYKGRAFYFARYSTSVLTRCVGALAGTTGVCAACSIAGIEMAGDVWKAVDAPVLEGLEGGGLCRHERERRFVRAMTANDAKERHGQGEEGQLSTVLG